MTSGGSILPFGTKTSRPAEHKVMVTESRIFASGSQVVVLSGLTFISTSLFRACDSRLWDKQYHILGADSEQT